MSRKGTLLQMAKHFHTMDCRMRPANYEARMWVKAVLQAWSGADIIYMSVFNEQASWFCLLLAEQEEFQS